MARQPSEAVIAARARRQARAPTDKVRIEWFLNEVSDKVTMTVHQRVKLATELTKDKCVRNISTPVVKGTGPLGGRVVTGRSKPGEFPHADTTTLMKSVFSEVRETSPNVFDGYVGTPLDYGLILETRMNRSFLVRTVNEERPTITRVLTGPIA